MKYLMALIIGLSCLSQLSAQDEEVSFKFGKVTNDELLMSQYDADPDAAAVVLGDFGKIYVSYNQNDGFMVNFEQHIRVKIFNKNGYDQADVAIPFYQPERGNSKEVVSGISGFTYNIVNGKVEKEKLHNSAVFSNQLSGPYHQITFTMPKVSEGSVIEYRYKLTSPFIATLPQWYFQQEIPVVWSELTTTVPEYYHYLKLSNGFHPYHIRESSHGTERKPVTYKEQRSQQGMVSKSSKYHYSDVSYRTNVDRYVAKDIPAFRGENYVARNKDYMLSLEHQLQSTQLPGSKYEDILGSWTSIEKVLSEHERFGKLMQKSTSLKVIAEAIDGKASNDLEKATLAHEYIMTDFRWNGNNGYLGTQTVKSLFESKSGNVADLALCYIALCKMMELDVAPVLSSTREHGRVHPVSPILSKYNYVLAALIIDDEQHLIDVSDPLTPFGVLPQKCLNERGRIINKDNSDWVSLQPGSKFQKISSARFTISETGELNGLVQMQNSGYSALNALRQIKEKGDDAYKENKKSTLENFDIHKHELKYNFTEDLMKLEEELEGTIVDAAVVMGTKVMFNPNIFKLVEENPFKDEKRHYPVDIIYPTDESNIVNIALPEGYLVGELPESIAIGLPDNSATFHFRCASSQNNITLMSKLVFNKSVFAEDEYDGLKAFFDVIVDKMDAQIVIVKQ